MLPSQGGDTSSILVSRSEGLSRLTRSAAQSRLLMLHKFLLTESERFDNISRARKKF